LIVNPDFEILISIILNIWNTWQKKSWKFQKISDFEKNKNFKSSDVQNNRYQNLKIWVDNQKSEEVVTLGNA
jgi:hypothetical protein